MNLETKIFIFEILTPCFSGTALGKFADNAEIRVPPIRGNIRLWHNILLGKDNVKKVWGSAEKENTSASKVGVNLINVQCENKELLLPHKERHGGKSSAIMAGGIVEFELVRLVGCTDIDWKNAEMATKLWLLLGGMGARANRAAGSVWPCDDWKPNDEDSFYNILKELGLKNYSLALISTNENNSEKLRKIASNTIKHSAVFGCADPRQPFPVKFKVIKLNNSHFLLAHSEQREKLEKAFVLLKDKKDFGDWSKNIKTF